MNAPARSSPWARELLAVRAIWQPLGVVLSLWAWFGWLALWLAALLPEQSGLRGPNAGILIMAAALLGHASAALVSRLNLSSLTAAAGRLLLLLTLLGMAWRVHVGASGAVGAAGGGQWQAIWGIALGLGYAWWRAGRLSTGEALDPDGVLRRLFTGTLLSAAAVVLFPQATRPAGAVFLPLYVGGGLAGVALGQVNDASRRRGGRPLPFGLSWHAGLVIGVAFVALLGVGAGRLLMSDPAWSVAETVARLLAGLGRVLGSILAPVIEAVFRLLGPIFDALVHLLQSLLQGAEEVEITVPEPMTLAGGEGAEGEAANQALALLGVALRFLVTVLAAALFLWMAIRTTRRARQPPDDAAIEQIESAHEAGWKGGENGWRSFLRSAIRLTGRARGLYHAILVRRVYAQLLEWAAGEGRPRRLAETPLEFWIALASIRPDLRQDLDVITQAYLVVRYGENPEHAEMVNRVLASWDRIRHTPALNHPSEKGNSW